MGQGEFEQEAQKKPSSFVAEYVYFLKTTKKWWLLPILIVILAFGAIVLIAGSPVAPFIYALF